MKIEQYETEVIAFCSSLSNDTFFCKQHQAEIDKN